MSVDAHVEALTVHWRPDAPELVDDARFERVGRALAGDALEAAFAELDDPDELVCIRRLVLDPVRAGAHDPDGELIRLIREAVAGSLHRALAVGGDDVVRYRSLADARTDALVSLATGDRTRLWAWRQLGLWPLGDGPTEAGAAVAAVLERDGDVLAAVVAELDGPALDAVVLALGPDRLGELARRRWPEVWAELSDWPAHLSGLEVSDTDLRGVVAALGRSPLGRRLLTGPAWPGASLAALALMAVLAAEPSVAQRVGSAVAPRPAAAVALVLARAAHRPNGDPAVAPPDPGRHPVWSSSDSLGQDPRTGPSSGGPDGQPGADRSGAIDEDPGGGTDLMDPAATSVERPTPAGPASVDAGPVNRRFVTEWAGLLFLLPLVERTGLVARVLDGPAAPVGVRRVLYAVGQALGRRLVPGGGLDPGDPALLVWCGLAPGQDPPDAEPPRGDQIDGVGRLAEDEADRLVADLRRRVAPDPIAEADESELLVAVCARHGLVVADPGWIDVHLALDDVSTVVRRAGLDLDPGYRPWLGVVVRFRYA